MIAPAPTALVAELLQWDFELCNRQLRNAGHRWNPKRELRRYWQLRFHLPWRARTRAPTLVKPQGIVRFTLRTLSAAGRVRSTCMSLEQGRSGAKSYATSPITFAPCTRANVLYLGAFDALVQLCE